MPQANLLGLDYGKHLVWGLIFPQRGPRRGGGRRLGPNSQNRGPGMGGEGRFEVVGVPDELQEGGGGLVVLTLYLLISNPFPSSFSAHHPLYTPITTP